MSPSLPVTAAPGAATTSSFRRENSPPPRAPERFRFQEQDEGLQLLLVELLPSAPADGAPPAQVVRPEEDPAPPAAPEEDGGGAGDHAFDPTRAYRLADEILVPAAPSPADSTRRSLDYLLSLEGVASQAMEDTSQAARARADFVRLQRLYFQGKAPLWAYEKAVERYREIMDRMLFDDPLRGPR